MEGYAQEGHDISGKAKSEFHGPFVRFYATCTQGIPSLIFDFLSDMEQCILNSFYGYVMRKVGVTCFSTSTHNRT